VQLKPPPLVRLMFRTLLVVVAAFASVDAFMVPSSKLAVSSVPASSAALAVAPVARAAVPAMMAAKKPIKKKVIKKKPVKKVVKKPVKKVVKKPVKKVVKKSIKKGGAGVARRESARKGAERGVALFGSTFIAEGIGGGGAIAIGVWILIVLRFTIFYGFFGDADL